MLNINEIMGKLALRRRIFHSEDDFRHELACEIRRAYPNVIIRVERPHRNNLTNKYIDLTVEDATRISLVELKYLPHKLPQPILVDSETFDPRRTCTRVWPQFVNDLRRLEEFVDTYLQDQPKTRLINGYAILLTSCQRCWDKTNKKSTPVSLDVFDDTRRTGDVSGAPHLKDDYVEKWHDYSTVSDSTFGRFRYLACKVDAPLPTKA